MPPLEHEGWLQFLDKIPENARVLELGAGLGDYSYGMSHHRPDITYVMSDLVRSNLEEQAQKRQSEAQGAGGSFQYEIIPEGDFSKFKPLPASKKVDGVFANNTLYFSAPETLAALFKNVSLSMKPGAPLQFNHLAEPVNNSPFGITIYPISEEEIRQLLEKSGFEIDEIKHDTWPYTTTKTPLSTFVVSAHKKGVADGE